MVYYHDEYRRDVYSITSVAVQRKLASYHLHHLLRTQHCPFSSLYVYLLPALHAPSPDFPRRASPSAPELVSGKFSCRPRYAHQHDHPSVRTGLGSRLGRVCVGVVVD